MGGCPVTRKRLELQRIIGAALAAAEPGRCVRQVLRLTGNRLLVGDRVYSLADFARILVIGAGKGAAAMAAGLEECLGSRIDGGRVTVKYGYGLPLKHIAVGEAGHPTPDRAGHREALKALSVASETRDGELVFCLVSGGGSALWPAPVPGITLADKQAVTDLLLASGAAIDEINAVRKHLSQIKGGRLAAALAPATVVSLLLSDVVGDRPDVIASGPTSPDRTTFADAWGVIQRYHLDTQIQHIP